MLEHTLLSWGMLRAHIAAGALLLAGCSGTKTDDTPERARVDAPEATAPATAEPKLTVLVTGFHDWEELGEPPNVWRCRDNPSCRLLVGEPSTERPTRFDGPLVQALRTSAPDYSWRFSTLPVTWGAYESLDTSQVDVVVNLGLGVYDSVDRLFLEDGAYNLREGADAAGAEPDSAAFAEHGDTVAEPGSTAGRLAAFDGRAFGNYTVVVKPARPENSYLCNETHLRALSDVRASALDDTLPLRAAYFVHIPYADGDDYAALAAGVSGLVQELVAIQSDSD